MDTLKFTYSSYSFLSLTFILLSDVSSFTLTAYQSSDKAFLGNNPFTLSCTYSIEENELLFSIVLKRKRGTDSDFNTIMTFQSPLSPINVTYQDTSLESRTVATNPTESSKTATIVFSEIDCNDKATYRWDAFYADGSNKNAVKDSSFVVKAKASFSQDGSISSSPSTNIEEGDKVVFTCSGDVGNEPVGHLGWFYYLNNDTSSAVNASSLANTVAPVYKSNTCSYTRTSTLQLTMTKEFHNILVRCTVQQDLFNQFGDGYVQTNNIPVFYSPKVTQIEDKEVDEGREMLTLNCYADAYPAPIFSWVMPNGTFSDGPSINLTALQLGDNGTYTCVVYNTFKGVNHTVNETTYIYVRKTTTSFPRTTQSEAITREAPRPEGKTTTSFPRTAQSAAITREPPRPEDQSNYKIAVIILVCVVVGLLITIGIFVARKFVKKKNPPTETLESPENPSCYQDLTLNSNRVSSENNMDYSGLNTGFYDSLDEIQRNQNDSKYTSLQLRSTRPYGENKPPATIVNPRVQHFNHKL